MGRMPYFVSLMAVTLGGVTVANTQTLPQGAGQELVIKLSDMACRLTQGQTIAHIDPRPGIGRHCRRPPITY